MCGTSCHTCSVSRARFCATLPISSLSGPECLRLPTSQLSISFLSSSLHPKAVSLPAGSWPPPQVGSLPWNIVTARIAVDTSAVEQLRVPFV